jgi:hypothetical protein
LAVPPLRKTAENEQSCLKAKGDKRLAGSEKVY